MSIIKTFYKNSTDILDYDFDFGDWISIRGQDTIISVEGVVDPGLTLYNVVQEINIVKVFVGGGVVGKSYNVSCVIQTAGGRRKTATIRLYITE
ncbi:MAG TPA: hypothetical protein VFM18_04010 [Methanosarcina sp.]|nr:hypothetical protein [Methanosarcina sp.]